MYNHQVIEIINQRKRESVFCPGLPELSPHDQLIVIQMQTAYHLQINIKQAITRITRYLRE